MKREIEQLKEYLLPARWSGGSEKSESATDHLVFPFFKAIFGKKLFHRESDAEGADIYIERQIGIELKTNYEDWLSGFYQVLHYKKKGIEFSAICVIAHKFIGLWKVKDIPSFALDIANETNAFKSASDVGMKNARKTNKGQQNEILKASDFLLKPDDFEGIFNIDICLSEFVDRLKNLESVRQQINPKNFIMKIEQLKNYFDDPMEAIHCFYSIIYYWDITARVPHPPNSDPTHLFVIGNSGGRASERFYVNPLKSEELRKFIESHYIFTNEGSGLTVDYYFSRFDEVISRLDPEYTTHHGVFFTDINLSKFALWFVHQYFEKKLGEKYIVFDPAAGSGNLVTSWRNHIKHKIVSELEPDLLKIIERRMKADRSQIKIGFTIVPKTTLNEGLNFLDKSASEYMEIVKNELKEKGLKLYKPLAFLLNPPYKNTDENEKFLIENKADYKIHKSIIELTGEDAGRERYLAFLGQILNICILQVEENPDFKPILMIFTPTSWLIPRPTYRKFREIFDKHFKYEKGFIIKAREFFKIPGGNFPISFTIWSYNYNEKGNRNIIKVKDYTDIKKENLDIDWDSELNKFYTKKRSIIRGKKTVNIILDRGDLRDYLPEIKNIKTGKLIKQPRLNIYRNIQKEEIGKEIISGFPLNSIFDKENKYTKRNVPHGFVDGSFVGFMDNNTPVRTYQDNFNRISNEPDRVWFILFNTLANVNKSKIFSGPPDNRGFCAYDIESARVLFLWFSLSKAVNGRYPIWANQYDIWMPKIEKDIEDYFYSLCFAYGLSDNRCVVTRFEENNPVKGAPEVFVDNPLCPTNPDSFWSTTLDKQIIDNPPLAMELVNLIKNLYEVWNNNYCHGNRLEYVGLHNEPYFKYFNYPDFVTPYSGLIQIRKYAEIHNSNDLIEILEEIRVKTKIVLDEIYRVLIEDFKYFD